MSARPVDAAIQAALYDHLKALVLPKPLPLAPEGRDFDPKGKAYLRPTYMPAEAEAPYLSDDDPVIHSGLYQIDLFWPEKTPPIDALDAASAVAAHFRRGARFFLPGIDLRLSRAPSILPAMQEPGWRQIPVRAVWSACAFIDA